MCLYAKYGTCASCVISLKTLMQISLAAGLVLTTLPAFLALIFVPLSRRRSRFLRSFSRFAQVRTVLISWLCLYMIPRRLRALKAAEESLGSEKAKEMMIAHFGSA